MSHKIALLVFIILSASCGSNGGGDDNIDYQDNGFKVISVDPSNSANVPLNRRIYVTFNRPLDEESFDSSFFSLSSNSVSIDFACLYSSDKKTVRIIPIDNLPSNSEVLVSVHSGISDDTGNSLLANAEFSFETGSSKDMNAPYVLSAIPSDGASNVSKESKIEIAFSENMDSLMFDNRIILKRDKDIKNISYQYASSSRKLTVSDPNFEYSSDYVLTIEKGVTDLCGNPLDENYVSSFRIEDDTYPPSILSVYPRDGYNEAPLNAVIKIEVDEKPSAYNVSVFSEGEEVSCSSKLDGFNILVSKNSGLFLPGKVYSVVVTGLSDLIGNTAEDYSFSFTTEQTPGEIIDESISVDDYLEMVRIPSRYFKKGWNDCVEGYVKKSFIIAREELNYRDWKTVYDWAVLHGYKFANKGYEWTGSNVITGESDLFPVSGISWRDAIVWCNAFTDYQNQVNAKSYSFAYYSDSNFSSPIKSSYSGRDILSEAGSCDHPFVNQASTGFRLPTSDEWELAARYITDINGDSRIDSEGEYYPYNFASGATASILNSEATDLCSFYEMNSLGLLNKSGLKNSNSSGLYDMSGNVSEFCFDWQTENYYRIIRGGDYLHDSKMLQVGLINYAEPFFKSHSVGIRLCR